MRTVLDTKGDRLKDIANYMYPWSCLVCCRGFSRKRTNDQNIGLPLRTFNFINGAFGRLIEDRKSPIYERDRFLQREAPVYIKKIREGKQLSEEEWINLRLKRITITIVYESEEHV